MRRRLDAELVRRGLVRSRARAVEAIADRRVSVSGAPAMSAARLVAPDESIQVAEPASEFVSRGGHKLSHALDEFGIDPRGRRCVDAGASTGGFTDCLLQRGASFVVAIDVGRGQLAWRIRTHERVEVRERTNVRALVAGAVDPPADLVTADLSFISLRLVATGLLAVSTDRADLILLIKPQFEAGRDLVGSGGVVRSAQTHQDVLQELMQALSLKGLGIVGLVPSPITGTQGNIEFLAHARPGAMQIDDRAIERAVRNSHDMHYRTMAGG